MGQGYSLTTLSAASATIDVPELADLTHDKTLSSARFMKSIRARHQQGYVFVKAVMKPYPTFNVQKYVKQITNERNALADVPNALGYQRIVETGAGGFLVRQHIYTSVYDRMSTRPFLEDIEKKWIVFQLLCAVRDCHSRGIFHGDIKTENLLVTSWNWLYLADFSSSFKPSQLPEDNPADFSFYFDTSGRRTCYLAPERFTADGSGTEHSEIDWAMDIFSVGCVAAELFLESPIFSLSQIFKYRTGDYSPEHTHLNGISDIEVRDMILHMIDLDPEKRYSAEEYLLFYKAKIFPEYFYDFLHQYMFALTDPSSGQKGVVLDSANFGESDDKIDRIHADFDKVAYFLGYEHNETARAERRRSSVSNRTQSHRGSRLLKPQPRSGSEAKADDGTLLFLAVISSSLRNTARASARLKACELLVLFAERLPDEAKLDRILPYLVGLLNDKSDTVKVAALKATTKLLSVVEVVSPINAYIFPEYVFPRLRQFMLGPVTNPSVIIRMTYASCLASLAQSSGHILDSVQAIKADGRLPSFSGNDWAQEATYHGLFDVARIDLIQHFEEATKSLITDPDPSVRRAFLGSVSTLCVFFGSSKAGDVVLSYLNTYLNDKDWILRCSFFDALVGVAAYIGSANLQRFVLPLMIQSLTEPETFVVERVLRSLARMSGIGLLQKSVTWELLSITVRFLVHPSPWIREAAAQLVVLSTKYVSTADQYCVLMPIIQPFLKCTILDLSEQAILESVKKPLSKGVLDMAINWATVTEKGIFWKAAIKDSVFVLPDPEASVSPSFLKGRFVTRIPASQRNEEDEHWLGRLRGLGMTSEDEMKLLALREFVWRVARRRLEANDEPEHASLNNIISLTHIDVTPQNVFFDTSEPIREIKDRQRAGNRPTEIDDKPHTISQALLDASTTFGSESAIKQDTEVGKEVTIPRQPPTPDPIKIDGQARHGETGATSSSGASFNDDALPHRLGENYTRRRSTKTMAFDGNEERESPIGPNGVSSRKPSDLSISHRSSAMNLMKRNDKSKADAAVSTNAENAFGKLDGPQSRRNTELSPLSIALKTSAKVRSRSPLSQISSTEYEPNHTYAGGDKNVLRLLDVHFAENYPTDVLDFGEIKHTLNPRAPIKGVGEVPDLANDDLSLEQAQQHRKIWQPSGHLLTMFSEHTACVNRVVPSPDHTFFVTASDDGTCKIWDTTRLEKNVTPRSRHTYHHPAGSKVKALCFVENSHTFVSAADDGSIRAVKVEYKKIDGGESVRYGKPVVVREYQLTSVAPSEKTPNGTASQTDQQEHAVWLQHYRTRSSNSVLIVLTNKSRLIALDMKTMMEIYTLEIPQHHGVPSTFCLDRRHHWLMIGTSHGILDLYDLRFRVLVRSSALKTCARIDRIVVLPKDNKSKFVLVSSGGEVSQWDVAKFVCSKVYRPHSSTVPHKIKSTTKAYEPWSPDDEPREKALARFAAALSDGKLDEDLTVDPRRVGDTSSGSSALNDRVMASSTPALCLKFDSIYEKSTSTEPVQHPFIITGGSDKTIRYWNIDNVVSSAIISMPSTTAVDEGGTLPKPRYRVSVPTSGSSGELELVEEQMPKPGAESTDSPKKSSKTEPLHVPRNTVISQGHQALLRSHLDCIMDVCVLERPYGLVVSVDRAGGVYIFQ